MALHPRYLGNHLNLGLITHFNRRVNAFVPELDGILAGYGKLLLRAPEGHVMNDEAYIHIDVISDFWVLRPTLGSQIKVIKVIRGAR